MRIAPFVLAGALLVVVAGCGDDGGAATPPPAGCRAANDGAVTVVAQDLAWDTDCLATPAGAAVTISIDNRDDGVNHNLHVLGVPDQQPKTDLEAGPVVQALEVRAPSGEYVFVCDIHPNMRGDLRVG